MKCLFIICLFILSNNASGQIITPNDTTSKLNIEVRNKIISDSKNGGKLDFWTPIKGHEYDGKLIEKGATKETDVYATNKDIAIIEWAFYLSKLGINKSDIISLYEELKGRKVGGDISLLDYGIKKAAAPN